MVVFSGSGQKKKGGARPLKRNPVFFFGEKKNDFSLGEGGTKGGGGTRGFPPKKSQNKKEKNGNCGKPKRKKGLRFRGREKKKKGKPTTGGGKKEANF